MCTDITNDVQLNQRLKNYEEGILRLNLQPDIDFGLQHFSYNNSGVLDLIFDHLNRTSFSGITVSTIIFVDQISACIQCMHLIDEHKLYNNIIIGANPSEPHMHSSGVS